MFSCRDTFSKRLVMCITKLLDIEVGHVKKKAFTVHQADVER